MFKWIFKWVFRLILLAIVLAVIFFLSLNTIVRVAMEHSIRAQTGMDAEIGRVQLGLAEPTLTIQNLKIYNSPEFDGTPFLSIPEIHVEYDRAALAEKKIHITLMRFNLGELDIVKNEKGETNIFSLGIPLPTKKSGGNSGAINFKKETGFDFDSIDALNVSVGTLKYIDLKNPKNNREQKIGIENWPIRNVKSELDFGGLAADIALRSGDFFGDLIDQKSSKLGVFKQLGF